MCGFLRLKKNTTTCLQTELLDKDGKMNLLPLFFFFFSLVFLLQVGDSYHLSMCMYCR